MARKQKFTPNGAKVSDIRNFLSDQKIASKLTGPFIMSAKAHKITKWTVKDQEWTFYLPSEVAVMPAAYIKKHKLTDIASCWKHLLTSLNEYYAVEDKNNPGYFFLNIESDDDAGIII